MTKSKALQALNEAIMAYPGETLTTFVYGTLRPGQGNYWIAPAVLHVIEDCTTPGRLYGGVIPFADFEGDSDRLIHGTLLLMERDHVLTDQMIRMESGAGYKAVEVPITFPKGRKPAVNALAWQYCHVATRFHYIKPGTQHDIFADGDYNKVYPPRHRERAG